MPKRFIYLLATGISLCVGAVALNGHLNSETPKPSKASIIKLLSSYERQDLEHLLKEAKRARGYLNLLEKKNSSIDLELKAPGKLKRSYAHYPAESDVYDEQSGFLYYFHRHRPQEEGHFHIFAMDPTCAQNLRISLPQKEEAFSHIIALSINSKRKPAKLFCPNAWVTGEGMLTKEALMPYVKKFKIVDKESSWITSSTLSALIGAFLPQIEALLAQRDQRFFRMQKRLKIDAEALANDTTCEILSEMPIDLDLQIEALERLLS